MKITFTKIIYEDYEVDIPKQAMDEVFFDDYEQAIVEFMGRAEKVGEDIDIDDIKVGKLDSWDEQYLEELDRQANDDDDLLNSQFEDGLL
jgi:hypothetical protein